MQPEKYDVDFENTNVWKKYKEQWEFNPMATTYFTYLSEFINREDLQGSPEIYLAKLPKSFQNNELMQRYSLEEMQNMLYLCKYT